MFTKITPTTDSQLSNEDVANLVVGDALEKIAQLTGLSQEEAIALFVNQVDQQSDAISQKQSTKVETPLLEQSEFQFISSLFN